jgi:hypothetical protein
MMTPPAGHRMEVLVHVNCIWSLNAFPNITASNVKTPVASALYGTLLFLCHSFEISHHKGFTHRKDCAQWAGAALSHSNMTDRPVQRVASYCRSDGPRASYVNLVLSYEAGTGPLPDTL